MVKDVELVVRRRVDHGPVRSDVQRPVEDAVHGGAGFGFGLGTVVDAHVHRDAVLPRRILQTLYKRRRLLRLGEFERRLTVGRDVVGRLREEEYLSCIPCEQVAQITSVSRCCGRARHEKKKKMKKGRDIWRGLLVCLGEIGPWPCLTAQDEPYLDQESALFQKSVCVRSDKISSLFPRR